MPDEMVTITLKEYQRLLESDTHLHILSRRGVDNWDWYCGVPTREEGMTDEQYEAEVEKACNDEW